MNVSVIGLGKLGLPIACALASRGIGVIGLDRDEPLLQSLRHPSCGLFSAGEPGVTFETVQPIQLTSEYRVAVGNSDLTLVIVPTPSDPSDRFSNEFVLSACAQIGRELGCKKQPHTVVIVSTVMPGSIDGPIRQALEESSRSKAGADFSLLYNPQFVALGSVIHDFTLPDVVLVGKCNDSSTRDWLAMYDRVLGNLPQIAVTTAINAELAKLGLNCAVSAKINFANHLAMVAENFAGADIDVITGIIGADSRIGPGYLRAAVNYGGPCFPRDVRAIASLDRGWDFFIGIDRQNRSSIRYFCWQVERAASRGDTVGILGMGYKVGSPVTDESLGIHLAGYFRMLNHPVVSDYGMTPEDLVRQSKVVVIALPDPRYRDIPAEAWSGQTVFDVWRLCPELALNPKVSYRARGIGPR